jgi:hypothetical protein
MPASPLAGSTGAFREILGLTGVLALEYRDRQSR